MDCEPGRSWPTVIGGCESDRPATGVTQPLGGTARLPRCSLLQAPVTPRRAAIRSREGIQPVPATRRSEIATASDFLAAALTDNSASRARRGDAKSASSGSASILHGEIKASRGRTGKPIFPLQGRGAARPFPTKAKTMQLSEYVNHDAMRSSVRSRWQPFSVRAK